MKETLSIVSDCELGRIDDFLIIRDDGEVTKIPIRKILDIEIYSEVEFNTGVLKFLHKNEVGIMFYDDYNGSEYGNYNMFNPRASERGKLRQLEYYQDNRLSMVKYIYSGLFENMIWLATKYQTNKRVGKAATRLKTDIGNIKLGSVTLENYLGVEAGAWVDFYRFFGVLMDGTGFEFFARSKRPPEDQINALVSYINTKLYFLVNSKIKQSKLDPRIGYIHELTDYGRMNLALDVAEIFKPLFTFRFIIELIFRHKIVNTDFDGEGVRLSRAGLRKLNIYFNDLCERRVYISGLRREVSYETLIKMECQKIYKAMKAGEIPKSASLSSLL